MFKILTSILFVTFTSQAFSQVVFSGLSYTGTGCPQGSVGIASSPDGSSVAFLFDEFRVQVPQFDNNNDNGRRRNDPTLQNKACFVSFDAQIPAGQMVESLEISIFNRGAAILDSGVSGAFYSSFVSQTGLRGASVARPTVVEHKIWNAGAGGVSDDWISEPTVQVPINSACASNSDRTVRFQLKNHLGVEINDGRSTSKSGIVTVDSTDVNGSLKVRLRLRACGGRSNSGPIVPPRRRG